MIWFSNQKTQTSRLNLKIRSIYLLSTRNPPHCNIWAQLQCERTEMIFHTNGIRKQAAVVILTVGKIGFKPKLIRRDKEGCFILIKRLVY